MMPTISGAACAADMTPLKLVITITGAAGHHLRIRSWAIGIIRLLDLLDLIKLSWVLMELEVCVVQLLT